MWTFCVTHSESKWNRFETFDSRFFLYMRLFRSLDLLMCASYDTYSCLSTDIVVVTTVINVDSFYFFALSLFLSILNCVVPSDKYKSCNMNDTFGLAHLFSILAEKDQDFLIPVLQDGFVGWVRLSDLYSQNIDGVHTWKLPAETKNFIRSDGSKAAFT